MATNERRALLRHLGIKLVEHASVELRDLHDAWANHPTGKKVAVLRNFTDVKYVWTGDPAWVEKNYDYIRRSDGTLDSTYRNYLALDGTFGYADWPLRLEGLFESTPGVYMKYEVDKHGRQWYWKLSGVAARRYEHGSSVEGAIDLRRYRPITLRDIPAQHRRPFMWAWARMLMDSNNLRTVDWGVQLQLRLQTMGFNPHDPYGYNHSGSYVRGWRKSSALEPLSGPNYLALRQSLKELGAMIANPTTDTDAFLERFTRLSLEPYGHYFVTTVQDAWTRRHPDSRLVQCSCGHPEMQDEVTTGVGGQTICRHCIESGTYRLLEDLQLYGQHGHQHGDGLWYSYPDYTESDDDDDEYHDDDDNTPGVRSYTTDVRSYLRADPSIKPSIYGDFLMGIELEVVPEYDRAATARHTMRNLANGYAILKNDSSLNDGGFEIVTAPRGLKEHIERFTAWKPHQYLRAWDAGCCGLHVHLSSAAFTAGTLGKFIEFINSEDNDEFIRSIAGRHPRWDSQAEDYCQRDGCQVGNPKKTLQDKSPSRYYMVNTTNVSATEARRLGLNEDHANGRPQNTIEIRVFRASLKKARLLAQIEFAHAAVMFCRWSSMRELNQKHFLKWLKGMAGIYPNLAKWFGVRANTEVVDATPKARVGADV